MVEKILFVTGDRADYDLLKPVSEALLESGNFDVGYFVAGTHQLEKYGSSIERIREDGVKIIASVNNLLHSDAPSSRAKSLGLELLSLVDTIDNFKPQMVVVLGDREESLAAATACIYSHVICVHLCGGDSTSDGNSDNSVRDAVSKLAHVHFTSTEGSRQRLMKIGEDKWRIFNYGATGLDSLSKVRIKTRKDFFDSMDLKGSLSHFAVLIQHPILSDLKNSISDLRASLEALKASNIKTFVGRSNSDPGGLAFNDYIIDFCSKEPNFIFYNNLRREEFVNMLHHASVLVGNSSSGIIESAFLKLPVVNVGLRQKGRQSSSNVMFVDGEVDEIKMAISKALYNKEFRKEVDKCVNPYGNGTAAEKIAKKLLEISNVKEKYLFKMQVKIT